MGNQFSKGNVSEDKSIIEIATGIDSEEEEVSSLTSSSQQVDPVLALIPQLEQPQIMSSPGETQEIQEEQGNNNLKRTSESPCAACADCPCKRANKVQNDDDQLVRKDKDEEEHEGEKDDDGDEEQVEEQDENQNVNAADAAADDDDGQDGSESSPLQICMDFFD